MAKNPFWLGLVLSGVALMQARAADPAEQKMREALRNTMLQLRSAETEKANLQAAQAENDQKLKAAAADLAQLKKQAAADQEELKALKAKLGAGAAENARLAEALDKWKAGHQKVTEIATALEKEKVRMTDKAAVLERRCDEQQTRNVALHKIATEILERYRKFGIGDAITAREPFIGITRVKLQNLVQDYTDKISEQRIKP